MKRLALLAALFLAGCGSARQPVAAGPRLHAEPAASFRDDRGPGREAAFSPDGRILATTSASGLVVLRRMPDLKIIRRLSHRGGAAAVAFSPDGEQLATAGYDGAVRLWETGSGRPAGELGEALGTLWSLDYSPDGSRLAAAGQDGVVRIWTRAGRLAARLGGARTQPLGGPLQPRRSTPRQRKLRQQRAAVGSGDREGAGHSERA